MREPGGLSELGSEGARAWSARVDTCLAAIAEQVGANPFLLAAPDERTPHVTAPDWLGFPARVGACLRRRDAMPLLDWRPEGRRSFQEEYVEWRVVADEGAIRRSS